MFIMSFTQITLIIPCFCCLQSFQTSLLHPSSNHCWIRQNCSQLSPPDKHQHPHKIAQQIQRVTGRCQDPSPYFGSKRTTFHYLKCHISS